MDNFRRLQRPPFNASYVTRRSNLEKNRTYPPQNRYEVMNMYPESFDIRVAPRRDDFNETRKMEMRNRDRQFESFEFLPSSRQRQRTEFPTIDHKEDAIFAMILHSTIGINAKKDTYKIKDKIYNNLYSNKKWLHQATTITKKTSYSGH